MSDKILKEIEDIASNCDKSTSIVLSKLVKDYNRKAKRLDRIIKQSDRQQLKVLKLNEKLDIYKNKLERMREYDISQQNIAKKKVEATITDSIDSEDLIVDSVFIPSDILSGDFYSIYKKNDGAILLFVLDGQGHGISPSLTVFSVASIIGRYVKNSSSLQELLDTIFPYIKQFLGDEEQLSYTIMEISSDYKKLDYSIGGMYPAKLKVNGEVMDIKTNSLPILNFSPSLTIDSMSIEGFEKLIVYSDGLVEGVDDRILDYSPDKMLIDDELINISKTALLECERDDDITVLSILKKQG